MYRKISEDCYTLESGQSTIEKLGGGVWLVAFNPKIGYYLTRQQDLELPNKIYGHNTEISDKIISTFKNNTGRSTGIMLEGVKGSGKTLTAIEASKKLNDQGYPVLLIKEEFFGTDFDNFIQSITEPCVVFIDEFEKIYTDDEAISSMLLLLDGAVKTTKLFLLTSNSNLQSNDKFQFLYNRPSRIRYVFKFSGMSDEAIKEYLDDNLKFKVYENEIQALNRSFYDLTIDMLKAIVDEFNNYGDELGTVKANVILKDLNVKTDRDLSSYTYDRTVILNNTRYALLDLIESGVEYEVSPYKLEQILNFGDSSTFTLYFHNDLVDLETIEKSVGKSRAAVIKSQISAGDSDSEHVKNVLKDKIERSRGRDVPEFMKSSKIEKPFTQEELDALSSKQHKAAKEVTPIQIRLWDANITNGSISVSQDEVTRAITFEFSPNFKIEFKPKIKPALKDQIFVI